MYYDVLLHMKTIFRISIAFIWCVAQCLGRKLSKIEILFASNSGKLSDKYSFFSQKIHDVDVNLELDKTGAKPN